MEICNRGKHESMSTFQFFFNGQLLFWKRRMDLLRLGMMCTGPHWYLWGLQTVFGGRTNLKRLATQQKPRVLFRLLTLQIAFICLLNPNYCSWVKSRTCLAKGKNKTLISPSGRIIHGTAHCAMEGKAEAIYRCGLGQAQRLDASAVMLIRNQIKLLSEWISWWVSKASGEGTESTAVARIPPLQQRKVAQFGFP